VIRGLKAQLVGEIDVAGPDLAGSLTDLGLIDEYRLYLHPVVLGRGKPFFAAPSAAPPCGQRSDWRRCDQVDLRSCLITQLADRLRRHLSLNDAVRRVNGGSELVALSIGHRLYASGCLGSYSIMSSRQVRPS